MPKDYKSKDIMEMNDDELSSLLDRMPKPEYEDTRTEGQKSRDKYLDMHKPMMGVTLVEKIDMLELEDQLHLTKMIQADMVNKDFVKSPEALKEFLPQLSDSQRKLIKSFIANKVK